MPTSRGWAAAGVSGALLLLWAGFGEIELLATALFLLLAVAGGVAFVRAGTARLEVGRRIYPAQAHEGDQVTVEVTLLAAGKARHLTVEDTVHGLGVARFAAAATTPGQHLVARYEVFCRARGIYPVGPAEVAVADPFALTERRVALGGADRLTVYPAVEPLTGFPAVRGLDPAVQSTHPTFAPQGGEDFFTLREYQIGDDLRKVHWPSSAKRDELMIKQLEVPWQARALVLLDQRAERYPTPEAFEHAVRGAASVVTHLYRGGFSPELWTGERAPGLRSDSRFTQAMEVLASVQPLPALDLRQTVTRLPAPGGRRRRPRRRHRPPGRRGHRRLPRAGPGLRPHRRPRRRRAPRRVPARLPAGRGRHRLRRPGQPVEPGVAHRHGAVVVYRFSWLAGIAGVLFALVRLERLLRSSVEGLPWEAVLLAAAVLGAALTWAGLAYRLSAPAIVAVNLAAMLLTVVRIAVPSTTWFIFPTPSSFPALGTEISYAFDVIRTGVAPVLPLAGIIALLAVVFWALGTMLAAGLRGERPYLAVLAPLVAYLQFATMDRRRSGAWTVAFVLLLGLALLAVASDRRRHGTGLLTTGLGRAAVGRTRPALAAGALAVLVALTLASTTALAATLPRGGLLELARSVGPHRRLLRQHLLQPLRRHSPATRVSERHPAAHRRRLRRHPLGPGLLPTADAGVLQRRAVVRRPPPGGPP